MRHQMNRMFLVFVLFFCLPLLIHAQDNAALTDTNSVKQMARVSADGLSVVFVGDKEADNGCQVPATNNQEIFLLDAGDNEIRRLTENDTADTTPSISADGDLIAFSREEQTGRFAVFIYDVRTDEERLISAEIQTGSSTFSATRPMISADGSTVVYEQNGDIFVVPADGSSPPSNITDSPNAEDQFPTITSDGNQIAFASNGDYLGTNPTGDVEIFAFSSSGKNLRQLTRNEVPDLHPWMSGNGAFVAFERVLGEQNDIVIVPADGGSLESNLTLTSTKSERFPSLNETGDVVAFELVEEGQAQYAKMNRDGTGLIVLSQTESAPEDFANITLTGDGERAAFTAQDEASDCRQLFLSGPLPNRAPLANGGGDQTVAVGDTVQLDASESNDPDGDPLTFNWEIVSKPEDSQAVLDDPTSATPTFVADVAGEYLIDLTVEDGRDGLDSDKINVMATGESPPGSSASTIEQALDVNDNNIIDDDEIITAISFWVLGTPIDDSDLIISDDQILGLIELWILGTPFEEE